MKNIPEGFFYTCNISEIQNNKGKKFFVNDEYIAVFCVNGNYYATTNICPHQHANIIHDGFIEDKKVVCPAHGWEFDLETGKQPDGRRGLTVYETLVIENKLYVKVIPKKINW